MMSEIKAQLWSAGLEMKELAGLFKRREDEAVELIQRSVQAEGDLLAANKRSVQLVGTIHYCCVKYL
jgi:hypothetical protein